MTKKLLVINDLNKTVTEEMPIIINPDDTVDIDVPLNVDVGSITDFHSTVQTPSMLLNWAGFYAWDHGEIHEGTITFDSKYSYISAWSNEMWASLKLTDGFSNGQQIIIQCFGKESFGVVGIYVYVSAEESVELFLADYCRLIWMDGKWNIIQTNGMVY